jgi:hypothetical protein
MFSPSVTARAQTSGGGGVLLPLPLPLPPEVSGWSAGGESWVPQPSSWPCGLRQFLIDILIIGSSQFKEGKRRVGRVSIATKASRDRVRARAGAGSLTSQTASAFGQRWT